MGGRGSSSWTRTSGIGLRDSMWGFERLRLPEKEYGIVMHNIDTNYSERFAGKNWGTIPVDMDDGAYLYTFIIYYKGEGDDIYRDYFIIDKERIE